jgi:hypothetical protein
VEKKTYTFEYSEKAWYVVVIPLIIFFISLLMLPLLGKIALLPTLLITLGIPFLVVYLLARNLKKFGEATFIAESIIFNLENRIVEISFNEIVSYRIRSYRDTYDGTFLGIQLIDGDHFSIGAHFNHAKPSALDEFCVALKETIENRNERDAIEVTNNKIVREKNYLEKKWPLRITFYSLSILTIANFISSSIIYSAGVVQVTFGLLFACWIGLMAGYMIKERIEIREEKERLKKARIRQNSSSLTNSNSSFAES